MIGLDVWVLRTVCEQAPGVLDDARDFGGTSIYADAVGVLSQQALPPGVRAAVTDLQRTLEGDWEGRDEAHERVILALREEYRRVNAFLARGGRS